MGLAPCGNSNPNGGNAGRECTQADDLTQDEFNKGLARYIFERASQGYLDDTGGMTTSMFVVLPHAIENIYNFLSDGRLTPNSIIRSNPGFAYMLASHAKAFMNAVLQIEKKIGRKLLFEDVFRPTYYQKELRESYEKAKKAYDDCWILNCGNEPLFTDEPGRSTHQAGASFDLPMNDPNKFSPDEEAFVVETFSKAGFSKNVDEEHWHFTIKGYGKMRENDPAGLKNVIDTVQNKWINLMFR